MANQPGWAALGQQVRARREARGLSGRKAETAGGPSEPTWRRVEAGETVSTPSLYRICHTLGLEEEEARSWFALVGLTFDPGGYQRPETYDRLISSLKGVKREAETALAAAMQLEAESRDQQ